MRLLSESIIHYGKRATERFARAERPFLGQADVIGTHYDATPLREWTFGAAASYLGSSFLPWPSPVLAAQVGYEAAFPRVPRSRLAEHRRANLTPHS